nr:MAG TPA: hypothetical protein [Bacteriophage sp.]
MLLGCFRSVGQKKAHLLQWANNLRNQVMKNT